MVRLNGERLRRLREWAAGKVEARRARRAEEKFIKEQERLLRQAYAPELARGRRAEIEALRREIAEMRELAQLEALRKEVAELRRARPAPRVGIRRVMGGLAQWGEVGQRMLPPPAKPTPSVAMPRLFAPAAPARPEPDIMKKVPYVKKGAPQPMIPIRLGLPRRPGAGIGLGRIVVPRRPLISLWHRPIKEKKE